MYVKTVAPVGEVFLRRTETIDQIAEAHANLLVVVQNLIRDSCRVNGEMEHVHDGTSSCEEWWRVLLVFLKVDDTTIVENTTDIITFGEMIERSVAVDGEVSRIVDVEPVVGNHNKQAQQRPYEEIECAEEVYHQRVDHAGDDVPVKCGQGVDPQTVVTPCYQVQHNTPGDNLSDLAEVTEASEYIIRYPEVNEHAEKGDSEEAKAGAAPDLSPCASDGCVGFTVKGCIKGYCDET